MKSLFLMRHAKSDHPYEELHDFDRFLTRRGYSDAHEMGKKLSQHRLIPELIVSSPAIRAISTAIILAKEINYPADKLIADQDLYEKGNQKYIDRICRTPDTIQSLALVGHNPLIAEVSLIITKQPADFPPCAVGFYHLRIESWKDFKPFCGEVVQFFSPNS
jgi:phosphohistidine phosphatase